MLFALMKILAQAVALPMQLPCTTLHNGVSEFGKAKTTALGPIDAWRCSTGWCIARNT